jgi:hypothetical protein
MIFPSGQLARTARDGKAVSPRTAHRSIRMKRSLIVAAAVLGVWACGQSAGDARTAADTLTRRQKDSIVAGLPIPGARGVGRAIEAADRANARTEAHDTIR